MSLREQKKRKQREAILEVAERGFREKGFQQTRVQDLIEVLEISEPTFFNYFPSKQAVADELALRWLEGTASVVATAAGELEQVAPEPAGFVNLFDAFVERVRADPEFARLVFLDSSLFDARLGGVPMEDRWVRLGDRAAAVFAASVRYLEAAQKAGFVRGDVEAAVLAGLYHTVFVATVQAWLFSQAEGEPFDLEARLHAGRDVLTRGVLTRKRPDRSRE